MKLISALFLILFIHLGIAGSKPNVVILYADDMGVADISYGNPKAKIQTPYLDTLAQQGMTFTDGHSSSGICTPSRFALLTGQHHWRRFHNIVGAFGETVFKPDDFTIAKMFKQKGYNTGCFGKWHLGWDFKAIVKPGVDFNDPKQQVKADSYDWTKPFPDGPLDQGFDYYFGDGTINFPPYCWIENDRFLTIPSKPVIKSKPLAGAGSFRPGPMAEGWSPYDILPTVTEKTVEWIKKQDKDKPFFAYLAFNSPHYPIVPNKEFHGRSQAGYYGDFMIETDAMVGKIMDALEKSGLAENTIVVFTADNGAENLAYSRIEEFGHWSSGDFRGLKRDIYEGGHRVPFIVKWPKQIAPGTISDEVINQVDLAATFADIIDYNLAESDAIDSYNFLPVFKGEKYKSPLRKATVQNTYAKSFALRQSDWVYMTSTGVKPNSTTKLKKHDLDLIDKKETNLLFNLKDDPRQAKNISANFPERVEKMKALLESYVNGERCAPKRDK